MADAYTRLTSIHDPATGNTPPASWGDQIHTNFEALHFPPLAHVYNSAVQSIGDAADTVLTFDSENEDTDTLHSVVSNTGRITAAKAGWYLIAVYASWASNSTGRRRLTMRKNGTAVVYVSQNADSGGTTNQNMLWVVELQELDYVDVLGYQNSGGNLDLTAELQAIRVAGT